MQDAIKSDLLVKQAQELIEHSKETFWVDKSSSTSPNLCVFEQLAWSIYQRHVQNYESLHGISQHGGAEWWVQVKDSNDKGSAIDLHYDKDEALAESFGIGSFPVISTVTYLTVSSKTSAPTIVFDHTYSQGEEELINNMLVSRPHLGKHLVFDGTLLHGAPADPLLKPYEASNKKSPSPPPPNGTEGKEESGVRVTFLVNIWKDRRPANVHILDDDIRQKLLVMSSPLLESPLVMTEKPIPKAEITKEEELPEPLRHRLELPFVSKGATWEDQLNIGEDDEGGLVVITFPPPPTEDTLLVTFGQGLQAYLDYPNPNEEGRKQERPEQHETGYV